MAVLPVKTGAAVLKPSVSRHVQMASATVCPHAMPLAIDAALSRAAILVSDTVRRASSVACWFGVKTPLTPYSLDRMTNAACTAAADRDAPAGPAGAT